MLKKVFLQNSLCMKAMKFLVTFTYLYICLSILTTPSVGFQIQKLLSHHEQADGIMHSLPTTLPRKLRVILDEAALPVKVPGGQVSTSNNNHKRDISGNVYDREENVIKGSRGTRQEWVEGNDMSQFFTMDYSHVRRRRPIHNKSLPVGP